MDTREVEANHRWKKSTIMNILAMEGYELDQKMQTALESCAVHGFNDSHLFLALYRLNTILTRFISLDEQHIIRASPFDYEHDLTKPTESLRLRTNSLSIVVERAMNSSKSKTLGVGNFLKSLFQICLEYGEDYRFRPYTVDMLAFNYGSSVSRPLSEIPGVKKTIEALANAEIEEDYQYIITCEGSRIVFRVMSVLGDYWQESTDGAIQPRRALLTHFKDHYGAFTADEIEELEHLMNNPKAKESEFQRFFVEHSHFLRRWDYREIYPQIYLDGTYNNGRLVPDFILTDRKLQRSAVLELKLPTPQLVVKRENRERFSSAIMEARAQLLKYRDWFRNPVNRRKLAEKTKMEIYEPRLSVLIGRSSEFADEFDRQRLYANNPDIEVVTYDDILEYAKRRRILIKEANL